MQHLLDRERGFAFLPPVVRALAVLALAVALAFALGGCHDYGDEGGGISAENRAEVRAAQDSAMAMISKRIDSIAAVLKSVRALDRSDLGVLRLYLQAAQVGTAMRFGVKPPADMHAVRDLVDAGRLVPLGDSTRYWTVRPLGPSLPYVTPNARAMLTELGRRFQARLDSIGLPAYRFQITSALRTGELQAHLRRGNRNAAPDISAHEFGTTVDLAYTRFSAPAYSRFDSLPAEHPLRRAPLIVRWLRAHAGRRAEAAADSAAPAMGAVLGRTLIDMQQNGDLQALREINQAVFHVTVARRYADRPARPGGGIR